MERLGMEFEEGLAFAELACGDKQDEGAEAESRTGARRGGGHIAG
jgi:hypothetical protein